MGQKNLFFFAAVAASRHDGACTSVGGYVGAWDRCTRHVLSVPEADRVVGSLVARIQHPLLPAHEQPADAARSGLHKIPGIEGI